MGLNVSHKVQLSSVKIDPESVGKGWLPYYFAVSAAVDKFSSSYAGYLTFLCFVKMSSEFIPVRISMPYSLIW